MEKSGGIVGCHGSYGGGKVGAEVEVEMEVSLVAFALWSKIERNKDYVLYSHLIIHCLTSEGLGEVSERAND